jgi:excisionase family DNA binding protein
MVATANPPKVRQLVRQSVPVQALREEQADLRAMAAALGVRPSEHPCALVAADGRTIPIPESVFEVLEFVVEVLARGDAVTVVPVGRQLTTQQAADLLNVSRQYLVRLLDDGKLPFTKTGTHRRLRIEDVLKFKAERDRERSHALDDLAALSEEVGGYEELK